MLWSNCGKWGWLPGPDFESIGKYIFMARGSAAVSSLIDFCIRTVYTANIR
jgi:hypothetical protein